MTNCYYCGYKMGETPMLTNKGDVVDGAIRVKCVNPDCPCCGQEMWNVGGLLLE
jgi:hypothetical protein